MERAYSTKCSKCGVRTVTLARVPYTIQFHDFDQEITVFIPDLITPQCSKCQTIVLDEEANRCISAAFRHQAGLLTPDEIRTNRVRLGLTQQELADKLGVQLATLARWETGGQIQLGSLDRFMRLLFKSLDQTHAIDRELEPMQEP